MLREAQRRAQRDRQLVDSEPGEQTGGAEPRSRTGSATPRASTRREGRRLRKQTVIEVEMSNQWSLSEQMAENPLANSAGASQPN